MIGVGGFTMAETGQTRRRRRISALRRQIQPGDWQAAKSELTRQDTLDAAIRCIWRLGFADATTTEIAKEAGISRGAVLHHFPTRADLITAAIGTLGQRRMADFVSKLKAVSADTPEHAVGVEGYWAHLLTPDFVVFHELTVAARTDPALDASLRPIIHDIEQNWRAGVLELFPEWKQAGARFDFAMDLAQFLMEGMALHRRVDASGDDRYARIRAFLTETLLRELNQPYPAAREAAE
jgi:AcrR family transcriptional regulator